MSFMFPKGNGAGADAQRGAEIGSIIPGVGTLIGAAIGGAIGGYNDLTSDSNTTPDLKAPQTQAPSPVVASTTAIQSQLAKEQNARSTGTLLTGPSGLTSDPTTTSSLLTGA